MKKSKVLEYKNKAKEILSKMTVEEKISQMCNASDGISRIGIAKYNWWNEALHGVARAGVATVFPQAIGLSATFDAKLLRQIGDVISTEGRAKHNEYKKVGDYSIYKGLTFWSPNINIFRDPRWGRGHETFGEDPCLTATMAIEFIKGIQGDDGEYLKASACVKHFVAHSGPEQGRHGFNCNITKKDFYETYFPAFERCIKDARVEGVMGAYNSVNGEICNASEKLIKNFLRDKIGFDGYYVSDCGAIHDIYSQFMRVPTLPEAAALAVKSGCNLNCGSVFKSLTVALAENLISERDIDDAVLRLLTTRLKIGLIGGDNCKFNDISYEKNDSKQNHKKALKASEESIVLLKNDGVLPLDLKKIKTVGVVGPNANEVDVLLGNYNGTPSQSFTVLDGIRKVFNGVNTLYGKGCHLTDDRVESCAEPNDGISEAVIVAKQSDVVVVCVGLSPRLEGEEGDSFNGDVAGDKRDLKLPGNQEKLIEEMIAVGKKVVVVNLSGSAVDLSVANKANAVIQAWYPGMFGGIAIANVLCGKVNPSGRLPVTFYKSCDDLPPFADYTMKNRTYKYYTGKPIYPFGYGLSYTQFEYSNLSVTPLKNRKSVLTVTVKNCGGHDGREVIQAYVKNETKGLESPICQLVAFKSEFLKKGESKTVKIPLKEYWLESIDGEGNRILAETSTIFVGGGMPNEKSLNTKIKFKRKR